ncbi:ribose-5-phosphate isomerase rki1 [Lobulomyces angularis]|nr:ribose-5-phosphate isomerase rki1 [Lobulomyces angularis]
MSNLINLAKKLACQKAVDEYVTNATKVIGIGSGSTIVYLVDYLKTKNFPNLKACIPTSFQSKQLIIDANLPLGELNQFSKIDVAFDGADEVDQNLNLIKGGGGCHLQEKLIASNAEKFVVVADYRKNSATLGENWKKGVPLEVIPFAYVSITEKLKSMGGKPTLRMAINKAGPVVTDNGNFIIDVDFDLIKNPSELNLKLIQISGVVETGLFCGMSEICYFGQEDGSVKVQRK